MLGSWYRALFVTVIVLPFLGQAFPTPGAIPIFVAIAVLLLPTTLLIGIADGGIPGLLLGDGRIMTIFALTVMTYIYGFLLSTDAPFLYLLRETSNGIVGMIVVFAIANSGWTIEERARLVRTMASALLIIGLFVGVLGAYKFSLFLSSAERLDFVVDASGAVYPWGTSLVTDYNFYSLTILVAILSALFLMAYVRPSGQIVLALLVAFLIVVGTLAGSRRFWVFAPILLGAQSIWMISRYGVARYSIGFSVLLLYLIGLPAILYFVAPDLFEFVFTSAWDMQFRFLTIFNYFDSNFGAGTGSRYEHWAFGINQLEGFAAWIGSGFDYMYRFSCEFTSCGGAGYPHMPIISAFLYGGAAAAVMALTLYVFVTYAGWRLLDYNFDFAWLFFPLLTTLLFGAISGNGPLSTRSYIIVGALCVGFLRAMHVDSDSTRGPAAVSAI
jgi:hypothetical protein